MTLWPFVWKFALFMTSHNSPRFKYSIVLNTHTHTHTRKIHTFDESLGVLLVILSWLVVDCIRGSCNHFVIILISPLHNINLLACFTRDFHSAFEFIPSRFPSILPASHLICPHFLPSLSPSSSPEIPFLFNSPAPSLVSSPLLFSFISLIFKPFGGCF